MTRGSEETKSFPAADRGFIWIPAGVYPREGGDRNDDEKDVGWRGYILN